MALTKARLSLLVVITTFVGFWVGSRHGFDGWRLVHTLLGTTLCAFGSAVLNQLMEMEPDAQMKRTADRPLPARRLPPPAAFAIGVILSAWGLLHLDTRVNPESCAAAAATLVSYVLIYTPLKQRSNLNTLVGAVSGALPPLIGWAAAAGPAGDLGGAAFNAELFLAPQSVFLFGLLFLWQLPHFVAINWMYREEYVRGGFVMWSNNDVSGKLTSTLAILFTLPLFPLMLIPWLGGFCHGFFTVGGCAVTLWLLWLAVCFFRVRERPMARKLFFGTLLYLPLVLILLVSTLRRG